MGDMLVIQGMMMAHVKRKQNGTRAEFRFADMDRTRIFSRYFPLFVSVPGSPSLSGSDSCFASADRARLDRCPSLPPLFLRACAISRSMDLLEQCSARRVALPALLLPFFNPARIVLPRSCRTGVEGLVCLLPTTTTQYVALSRHHQVSNVGASLWPVNYANDVGPTACVFVDGYGYALG